VNEALHVASFEELAWGLVLVAVTMTVHAFAMPLTLATATAIRRRANPRGFIDGVRVLLIASGLIVITHLVEVAAWAGFLQWRGAFPSSSSAFYYALLQYTTVGSDVALPERWDLLGGMIAIAGALAFAWSTAVLLALAVRFQDEQLRRISRDHGLMHD
jgi:hypothetical protein